MTWLRNLLWQWRVRNRILLAWWAFRNPDSLTMLRHELVQAAAETIQCRRIGTNEWQHHLTRHARQCGWWLRRFLDIPVR